MTTAAKARATGPLAGVKVLDIANVLAGPIACQVLGDFGADVIKVEHPRLGDPLRGHGFRKDGEELWWKTIARNKKAITIDLSQPAGADLLKALATQADVVVENFRPGTIERWGLGYDELSRDNPGLILLRISGFGQTGPYAERRAFGTIVESMSGWAHLTGPADGPPTLPPFGLADNLAALAGVTAVMMALYHRDARGGGGQVIDVSLLEPIMATLAVQHIYYDQLGVTLHRQGNRSENSGPRGVFRTSDDKWVAVSASSDQVAGRLMRMVGHPEVTEEPWFKGGGERARHNEELEEMVSSWMAARTRVEIIEQAEAEGIPLGPVYDAADVMTDPHINETGMVTTVEDPQLGPVRMHNVLFRMSATPGGIAFPGRALGADTDEVLAKELGLTNEQLDKLRAKEII